MNLPEGDEPQKKIVFDPEPRWDNVALSDDKIDIKFNDDL